MIYNFQLHRITLILIVALLGAGGGLLFFSGLLVGVSWQRPAAAAGSAIAAAEPRATDSPEPVRRDVSLPALGPAPSLAPPVVTAPSVTAPAISAPAVSLPAAPRPLSADAVHFPAAGLDSPAAAPVAAEPAEPPPAPRADPLRGLRPERPQEGFALQVGAFSQSENTQKLLQQLAARGFEPYVVRTGTRDSRQVESVRIGHFVSRTEAAAASSELARAEGIRAFVVRASGIVP